MKVYALPDNVPAPAPDYYNYDHAAQMKREDDHKEALKTELIRLGFKGKYTGEIYSEPVADGQAQYMFADAGAKSVLIHLPYGDAYNSLNVKYIPREVVIERIEAHKKIWGRR